MAVIKDIKTRFRALLNNLFKVTFGDSASLDAFGRLRVSEITTQIDLKHFYDKQPLIVDEVLNGTATATFNNGSSRVELATSASGDYAIMQTFQRFNYQSGKSQLIFTTFSNFGIESNIEKILGYYTSSTSAPYNTAYDGLMLWNDGADISFRSYRNGTETNNVIQSNWNIDKLNGSGKSGITIDFNKGQILVIDFEYLGLGRVRMGFVIDGLIYYAHEFLNANNLSQVYMMSSNQPLRWEIRQTGAGSGQFEYICATVGSEGAQNTTGKPRSDNSGNNDLQLSSNGITYAAFGMRLQADKIDATIDLVDIDYLAETNDRALIELRLNPTIGAGTFNYTDVADSSVQTSIGNQTVGTPPTASGGTLLQTTHSLGNNRRDFLIDGTIKLGASIDGTPTEIVVCITPLQAGLDAYIGINWRELI